MWWQNDLCTFIHSFLVFMAIANFQFHSHCHSHTNKLQMHKFSGFQLLSINGNCLTYASAKWNVFQVIWVYYLSLYIVTVIWDLSKFFSWNIQTLITIQNVGSGLRCVSVHVWAAKIILSTCYQAQFNSMNAGFW